jgi:RNA 2',3'-cyclic 3'-phosphodiesterase
VNPAASVQAGERVRLFCGLRLSDETADAIAAWQLGLDGGRPMVRPMVRPVPRDNLHFTLAFLGWQPRERIDEVVDVLRRRAAETEPPGFMLERYCETRSVGMLVFSRDAGAERLALGLQRDLLDSVERQTWLPHVTVLRFRARPRLQPALPELGRVITSDAAAYLSRLRPNGAEYLVVGMAPLGGK